MSAYPEAPGHKVDGTSADAAHKMRHRTVTLRETAFAVLRASARGMTADEVADHLHETVLAVRPRISELATMGRIEKTGERRKNASGMSASVWVAAKRGVEA